MSTFGTEHDFPGDKQLSNDFYYGVQTVTIAVAFLVSCILL